MRRTWLVLSAASLLAGATAVGQDNPQGSTPDKNAPQEFPNEKATRESDPRAVAFLKNKVDKTMYNLASHGVKDAVVRMTMENNPQFEDLTIVHYWQANPQREYTDVEGLSKDMTSFKQLVANQLGDHIHRALLLPASVEFADDILSFENDGDLVKITAESREARDNDKRVLWYTSDGRVVRGLTESSNPMTGAIESRHTYDLEKVGDQYLVKGITTRFSGRPTEIRLTYVNKGDLKVLESATVNSSRGTMFTKFDITFNGGIDEKVFSADQNTSK